MGRPPNKSRVTSLHEETYAALVQELVRRRKQAGKSQQTVAAELGWNQSIVAKIETAQRRIDVIELIRFAHVIGIDAARLVRDTRTKMIERGDL